MADTETVRSDVPAFLRSTASDSLWSANERLHVLEQARVAPIPSRLEEDWRKTDPELFPWEQLERVEPANTQRDVRLQALGKGEATGLIPLSAEADGERGRAMCQIAGDDYDARFLYYHKALNSSPVSFRIPRDFKGDPIELIQRATGPGLLTFTTILLIERGADVTLYDRWEVAERNAPVIGRVEIIVEEDASLTYIQEETGTDSASLYRRARIQLQRGARLFWYAMTPGAKWHVARLEIGLMGSGTEATFKGLFAGAGDARADHRTHQYHGAPNAKSDLLFKTLLTGHAHSIYQGLISVPAPAQKTDAYQKCRNLLIEPGTRADAIPKLEIIADDVRCTHGASMGAVNKDQLFYLQSRGLSRRDAIGIIATGFAEEIVRDVPLDAVRERWRHGVAATISAVSL